MVSIKTLQDNQLMCLVLNHLFDLTKRKTLQDNQLMCLVLNHLFDLTKRKGICHLIFVFFI